MEPPIEPGSSPVPLREIIARTVALKPDGRNLRGMCPAHPDASRSLYVSLRSEIFHCFGCGAGGDATRWARLRDGHPAVSGRTID